LINAKDSASGITILREKEAQNPAQADLMTVMYDGTDASSALFTAHPVGVLGYAIVANIKGFPQSSISASELENIFLPPGKPGVMAVGRLAGSGSRKALLAGVFGRADWGSILVSNKSCPPPSGYTACTEDYTWQVLESVNNIPNAIGYAGYTEFIDNQSEYQNVHVVNIAGTEPVANESFSFWVVEHLYTTTRPAALTADFLAFLPKYLAQNPQDGFLACPAVPESLPTDCKVTST
jgi:ABC-type phosphate transport system substrate-binding protein